MWLKKGDWKFNSNTFIRFEFRNGIPKVIIHERFEPYVKWTLRGLTAVGIIIGFVNMPTIWGGVLGIFLFLLEQFIEGYVFEYSLMIVQPFADFEFDPQEWVTNGYLFPQVEDRLIHFGPVFRTKEYAEKFFSYISSWNNNQIEDPDNVILISFVYEHNVAYSTYFYANPNRKNLDEQFNVMRWLFKKRDKIEQLLIMQTCYSKKIDLYDDSLFYSFIEQQPPNGDYFFVPFYLNEKEQPVPLPDLRILKNNYSYKERQEIGKNDTEYHMRP